MNEKSWSPAAKDGGCCSELESSGSAAGNPAPQTARRWHVVCDPFSWAGWEAEGAVRIPGPDGDREGWDRILKHPPQTEFLLVESVWIDFYKASKLSELLRLMRVFRKAGIPVFYWAKEDPPHFFEFLPLALMSDAVFTTEETCLPRYREAGFKGPVELLMFAAQPAVHRPYLAKDPEKKVFFAGAGRYRHADRNAAMEYMIRPAVAMGCTDLFARTNRYMGLEVWPEDCRPSIRGQLPYEELLREYSRYLIGLSVSSVPHSKTMFPRRVVEMPLADIFVISDNSQAVRRLFPEIPVVQYASETRDTIRFFLNHPAEREARLEALKRRILEKHTYAQSLALLRSLLV